MWCFLGILITPDIGRVILEMREPFLYLFFGKSNVIFKKQSWDQQKLIPVTWEVTSIREGPQCLDFFRMDFFYPSPMATGQLGPWGEQQKQDLQSAKERLNEPWELWLQIAEGQLENAYEQITKPKRRQLSRFRISVYRYEQV